MFDCSVSGVMNGVEAKRGGTWRDLSGQCSSENPKNEVGKKRVRDYEQSPACSLFTVSKEILGIVYFFSLMNIYIYIEKKTNKNKDLRCS